MTALDELLRRAASDLDALGVSFALIGGLAIGARTRPRFTADVDLAVAVQTDQEAEEVVIGLQARGYRPLVQIEQESTNRLATVRLAPPGEGAAVIDLLFASSGIEAEVVADAEPMTVFTGVVVPIARVPHLLALKVLSRDDDRRPQDHDLVALFEEAAMPTT